MVPKLEHQPQPRKLQTDTHTKNGVFPPIVVIISKSHMFRFQPKERMKLHFFKENEVSRNRIEATVCKTSPIEKKI